MSLFSKIKLPASLENLEKLTLFIADCAEEFGCTPERILEIILVSEEALVNIINYSYPEHNGDVEINCMIGNDSKFILKIIDTGIHFDIRSLSEPNVQADINERKVGGLGVHFIKTIVDKIQYNRKGSRNVLKLIFLKEK
jgi:serine/threonine-protein kinase RsbW